MLLGTQRTMKIKTNAGTKKPGIAIINGKNYTVDEKLQIAEADITQGERIVLVGSQKAAGEFIVKDSRIVDLKGRLMLPGFIDNHTHFTQGGLHLLGIDLRSAKSTQEFSTLLLQTNDSTNIHMIMQFFYITTIVSRIK